MSMSWIAIDTKTNRIVAVGDQSHAGTVARLHARLSGNKTIIRSVKVGMLIGDYD